MRPVTDDTLQGVTRLLHWLGVSGGVLRQGERVWLFDGAGDKFTQVDDDVPAAGTVIALPEGTLTVEGRDLPPPELARAEEFARALFDALRARRLQETVFEASLALCSKLSLQRLLARLISLTAEVLGAEASSVMLLDESRSALYWEVAEGGASQDSLKRLSLPLGQGIAGTVALTGTPIIVEDAEHDPRVARWVDGATGFRTRTIICVPIRFRDETLGVIQVLNKRLGAFTPEDRELLELIAAEAGVAIENAFLYERLEERVRLRTRDLAEANERLTRTLNELRETQAQLVQSEKMAALGSLVAGIAHEINTPLGAVSSNTDLLNRGLKKLGPLAGDAGQGLMEKLEELAGINTEACRRISTIVGNLRNFARLDEAEWKAADLREGLESTLVLTRHLHKDRIQIIKEFGEVPLVECHPGQINQVFMNLLVNAIQAIEGNGKIWLRVQREGEAARVEVQDTGCGIPEANLAKIFDPGFTTKGVGVGTGLGLAICQRIVQAHGGRIDVASQVGGGTKFTMKLPIRRNA
jgi:signal transduction histidine kinase